MPNGSGGTLLARSLVGRAAELRALQDAWRAGGEARLSSAGDVCGLYLDAPNVVTHVFTGTATIEESGKRKLEGQEAFLEIRLAVDGGARVFVTTW
jgi:hypothetical protein